MTTTRLAELSGPGRLTIRPCADRIHSSLEDVMVVRTLQYEVNCSILFTELPLLERPAAAKQAGFDAVEFWWPFPVAVPSDADVDAFVRAVRDAGVQLVGLNFFAGDMPGGDRGLVSWPARSRSSATTSTSRSGSASSWAAAPSTRSTATGSTTLVRRSRTVSRWRTSRSPAGPRAGWAARSSSSRSAAHPGTPC
jgi:hypothetical protein